MPGRFTRTGGEKDVRPRDWLDMLSKRPGSNGTYRDGLQHCNNARAVGLDAEATYLYIHMYLYGLRTPYTTSTKYYSLELKRVNTCADTFLVVQMSNPDYIIMSIDKTKGYFSLVLGQINSKVY